MAYHEAFWVVIGTEGPVIALAGLVAVGDLLRSLQDTIPRRPGPARRRNLRRSLRLMVSPFGRAYWLASATFLISLVVFSVAVNALAERKDVWSPALVGILGEAAMALLLFEAAAAIGAREMLRRSRGRLRP